MADQTSRQRKMPDDEGKSSMEVEAAQHGGDQVSMVEDNMKAATNDLPHLGVASPPLPPPSPSFGCLVQGSKDAYYRRLYSTEPDFKYLAQSDMEFAAFVKAKGQLDFTNPAAMMQLTRTLLRVDYGLKIELPVDRLCPPVPNRHNYILWLQDLMDSTSYQAPGRKVYGLDVGTGASCIYPLLGTAQRPTWHFVATDIDAKSLSYAQKNISINDLQDRIRLLSRQPADPLIPLSDQLDPPIRTLDFTMMNPPFYTSADEMLESAKAKSRPPHSACTGAPVEMVCDGGEVAHVSRLLDESLVLRDRVQWYTSMLGKIGSLEVLVEKLRDKGVGNYAITEFVQGNKTRRWALGWSFCGMRPDEHVARGLKTAFWKKLLPQVARAELVTLKGTGKLGLLVERVRDAAGGLELMSWEWDKQALRGVGRARENVWSRAWRRKRQREMAVGLAPRPDATEDETCRLGFAVMVEVGMQETRATLRWLEGHDYSLFESLTGFFRGKCRDI